MRPTAAAGAVRPRPAGAPRRGRPVSRGVMSFPLSPSVLFALAVVALVGVYLTQRKDFVFRARPGRFECWGRVPLAKQEEVARFLLEDLAVGSPVKVMGRWGP